jgi:hypothetical protein
MALKLRLEIREARASGDWVEVVEEGYLAGVSGRNPLL